MNPTVSVVIPTCNRPELLWRAISSVLNQTYQDFEIIIVDDGDKISARDIVESFTDHRVRYLRNDSGKHGGGRARNIGIAAARGQYIAFLDDDDVWLPQKLMVQVNALAGTPTQIGFVIVGAITESEHGEGKNIPVGHGPTDYAELALRRFAGFLTSTLMVKKEVFQDVGMFDESFPSHQEVDLMIRVTRKYLGIPIREEFVRMNMFEHEHIGGDAERRIRGRMMILEKYRDYYQMRPKLLALHYFQLGLWYRDSGKWHEATVYFKQAATYAWHWRYIAHWLLSCFRR